MGVYKRLNQFLSRTLSAGGPNNKFSELCQLYENLKVNLTSLDLIIYRTINPDCITQVMKLPPGFFQGKHINHEVNASSNTDAFMVLDAFMRR